VTAGTPVLETLQEYPFARGCCDGKVSGLAVAINPVFNIEFRRWLTVYAKSGLRFCQCCFGE
jgi:hypothetical protein